MKATLFILSVHFFLLVELGETRVPPSVMCSDYQAIKSSQPCSAFLRCGGKKGYVKAMEIYPSSLEFSYIDYNNGLRHADMDIGSLRKISIDKFHMKGGTTSYGSMFDLNPAFNVKKLNMNPAHPPHILAYSVPIRTKMYKDMDCKHVLYQDISSSTHSASPPLHQTSQDPDDRLIYSDIQKHGFHCPAYHDVPKVNKKGKCQAEAMCTFGEKLTGVRGSRVPQMATLTCRKDKNGKCPTWSSDPIYCALDDKEQPGYGGPYLPTRYKNLHRVDSKSRPYVKGLDADIGGRR